MFCGSTEQVTLSLTSIETYMHSQFSLRNIIIIYNFHVNKKGLYAIHRPTV